LTIDSTSVQVIGLNATSEGFFIVPKEVTNLSVIYQVTQIGQKAFLNSVDYLLGIDLSQTNINFIGESAFEVRPFNISNADYL